MNLKEFASLIGLSQTTVSRALSGYPEVRKETRERILQAARQHGYHPNTSASGLATGRAGAIGIVQMSNGLFGPHMSEFLGGLGGRLIRDQMDILISTVETREAEEATYRRLAASKRVDAIVLHSPELHDPRIALLNDIGLPFVLHGRTNSSIPHAFLDIDNFSVAHKAAALLLDLGHRRIALINGYRGRTFAEHRDEGFRIVHAERGLSVDAGLIGNDEFTDEAGFRLMQAFLERPNPPTAAIAGSMMSALGALRAIRSAGLTLGRDFSLIAHDDVFPYLGPDHMVPTLTTTRSSMRLAGEHIGELLQKLLGGAKPADLTEIWPIELIVRESTGPAPGHIALKATG